MSEAGSILYILKMLSLWSLFAQQLCDNNAMYLTIR